MIKLTCSKIYRDIPFSHRAPNHAGHCRNIHGHNWAVSFQFEAETRDDCGFVMDFGKLKPLKDLIETFDHALVLNHTDPLVKLKALQEVLDFTGYNLRTVPDCSCEGLAQFFLEESNVIIQQLTNGRVKVAVVRVGEDSKNSAEAYLLK
jgi:6-pyruvoyltetrahydropterin/6-carboxytetrahydropterin synthase